MLTLETVDGRTSAVGSLKSKYLVCHGSQGGEISECARAGARLGGMGCVPGERSGRGERHVPQDKAACDEAQVPRDDERGQRHREQLCGPWEAVGSRGKPWEAVGSRPGGLMNQRKSGVLSRLPGGRELGASLTTAPAQRGQRSTQPVGEREYGCAEGASRRG